MSDIKMIWLVIIILSISGCDFVYGLLDKEGAQEKKLIGEVIPFEKNPTIEEVQVLLKLYGYNPGKADGFLGRRTRDSLEKFQKDNNLKITRFIDSETWDLLKQFKDNQLIHNNKVNIYLVQSLLIKAGFDPGKIDGNLGPRTLSTIKAFQKAHQLKADGKVGYKTLRALSAYFQ